jgi:hypothetical protein
MRINPHLFGALVLAVFLGTILAFQAVGFWSVSGKVSASGEAVQPSEDDLNTIKGWMTLEQITTTYNVSLEQILTQFELPPDTPASTAIKDLETETFSVTELRLWLESQGEASTGGESASPETEQPEATPIVPAPTPVSAVETPIPTEHLVAEKTITGKTTIQNLLDWGVSQDVIESILGVEMLAPSTVIKDFVTGKGLEFSPVKALLQAEVDKTK